MLRLKSSFDLDSDCLTEIVFLPELSMDESLFITRIIRLTQEISPFMLEEEEEVILDKIICRLDKISALPRSFYH